MRTAPPRSRCSFFFSTPPLFSWMLFSPIPSSLHKHASYGRHALPSFCTAFLFVRFELMKDAFFSCPSPSSLIYPAASVFTLVAHVGRAQQQS